MKIVRVSASFHSPCQQLMARDVDEDISEEVGACPASADGTSSPVWLSTLEGMDHTALPSGYSTCASTLTCAAHTKGNLKTQIMASFAASAADLKDFARFVPCVLRGIV